MPRPKGEIKIFRCDCCEIKWQSNYHLQRHLKRNKITGKERKQHKTRSDKQEYICGICLKHYRSNWFLEKHSSCMNKIREILPIEI